MRDVLVLSLGIIGLVVGVWFGGSAGLQAAAQTMQAGVSVEMAVASHAVAVPEADREDAMVVTVNEKGQAFWGAARVEANALEGKIKEALAKRAGKVYIKADARVQYGKLENVLDAVRRAAVGDPVLLTRAESAADGKPRSGEERVPPNGLPVILRRPAPMALLETKVLLSGGNEKEAKLKINTRDVSWSDAGKILGKSLGERPEREALIKTNADVPFAQLVRLVDLCRGGNGKAVIVLPPGKPAGGTGFQVPD